MTFLGCDGTWLLMADGSTNCQGQLQTFTVQEMRDQLSPALTPAQKVTITGLIMGLMVMVWVIKRVRNI